VVTEVPRRERFQKNEGVDLNHRYIDRKKQGGSGINPVTKGTLFLEKGRAGG
jgi:hypothetical protein